MNRKFI